MVFSLIMPGLTFAEGVSMHEEPKNSLPMEEETATSNPEKIDEEVMKVLDKKEKANVLIEMTEQVDPAEAATEYVKGLSESVTAYEQKARTHLYLYTELKNNALETQASIINYLEQAEKKGTLETYETFDIMNVIAAEATVEVIEDHSNRPEVAEIHLDRFIEIDWSERQDLLVNEEKWDVELFQAPEV